MRPAGWHAVFLFAVCAVSAFSAQEQPTDYATRKQTVEQWVSQGKMEESRGAYVEAARLYARSLEIWPNHPEARSRYDAIQAMSAAQASMAQRTQGYESVAGYDPLSLNPARKTGGNRKEERAREKTRADKETASVETVRFDEVSFLEKIEQAGEKDRQARAQLKEELLHLRYALYGFALLLLGQLFFQSLSVILLLIALAQKRV